MNMVKTLPAASAQRNPHPTPVMATHQGRVRYADVSQLSPAPAGMPMTFEALAATSYPVVRHTWEGSYEEVLICTPEAVDLSRVTNGICPLLANHDRYGFPHCLLGIVEAASFEAGQLILSGRFDSGPMGSDVARRVNLDRTLRAVSIGYEPLEAIAAGYADSGLPIVHITRWALNELSFVTVPADPVSGSRFEINEVTSLDTIPDLSRFARPWMGKLNWGALPHPLFGESRRTTNQPMEVFDHE
jgi:hypothetical protein